MADTKTEQTNPTLLAILPPFTFPAPTKLAILVEEATDMANGIMYNSDTTEDKADCAANAPVPKYEANNVKSSYAIDSASNITMPGIANRERSINGADLMIAGCLPPFDKNLVKGELCVVVDIDRPDVAIAVGELMMDLDNVTDVRGMSGIIVKIGTVVGDKLASMGRDVADVLASRPVIEVQTGIENLDVNNDLKEDISQEVINDIDENGNGNGNDNKNGNDNHDNGDEEDIENKTENGTENDFGEENYDEYVLTTKDIDNFFIRSIMRPYLRLIYSM